MTSRVEDDNVDAAAGRTERELTLGPLFTAGVLLGAYGLLRRKPLAFAAALAAIWLDQRSELGRTLKERVRGLSVQLDEEDCGQPDR